MEDEVTYEDIAIALAEAIEQAKIDDLHVDYSKGLTTKELAVLWKISQERARQLISDGIEAGVVVFGGKVLRRNMTGDLSRVPVYMPKKSGS